MNPADPPVSCYADFRNRCTPSNSRNLFTDSETWTDVTKSLYTYRVCNIDNTDSALDADDVDKLLNGYEIPSYGQNWESAAYYIAQPLMDPADYMPERTPVTTPSSGEHAELSVEYLGTQDETGSFDKTAQVDYNGAEDPSVDRKSVV